MMSKLELGQIEIYILSLYMMNELYPRCPVLPLFGIICVHVWLPFPSGIKMNSNISDFPYPPNSIILSLYNVAEKPSLRVGNPVPSSISVKVVEVLTCGFFIIANTKEIRYMYIDLIMFKHVRLQFTLVCFRY